MKPLKNQQGSALLLVLMIMMVLTILTTAMLHFTYTEVLQVTAEEQSKQAYYLARTGAEAVVSVWLQQGATNKPKGKVNRVYFNAETNDFQSNEPTISGGYFEVTVEEAKDLKNDKGEYQYGAPPIRIASTATVGKYSRTVSLITIPFKYGDELGWYDKNGVINEGHFKEMDEEFVYLSLDANKDFKPKEKNEFDGSFSAKQLIFGSPIEIGLGVPNNQGRIYEANINTKEFAVKAESIYFHDIKITSCPTANYSHWLRGSWSRNERTGKIILNVPNEIPGVPYSEVPGGIAGSKYGKVYFDGENVLRQNYQWNASWLVLYYDFRIETQGSASQIRYNNKNLAGNAYYFKNGTDLLNLKSGDLIPITDDTERPKLRGIKPYYWE